ncbi:MAG TPA: hypothetical protein VGC72_16540 [Candidatus Elarobacter sp.]|jgi:hypothetical protein
MFASRQAFSQLRHRLRAGACILVIGSLQTSAALSASCPATVGHCPPQGCSTSSSAFAPFDPLLNRQKNHPDGPAVPKNPPFTVADTMDEAQLPVHVPVTPNGKDLRDTWKLTPEFTAISKFEARQGTVEGYVVHAKKGGAESCNCDIKTADALDTHLNVVDKPAANVDPATLPGVSLIAEITWRVRKNKHADWTVPNLKLLDLDHTGARVRITGDLLYDNVHWDMIHKNQRGTLWEIHPIRRIQVLVKNKWVDFSAAKSTLAKNAAPAGSAPLALAATAAESDLSNAFKPRWTPAQLQKLEQAFGEDRS